MKEREDVACDTLDEVGEEFFHFLLRYLAVLFKEPLKPEAY